MNNKQHDVDFEGMTLFYTLEAKDQSAVLHIFYHEQTEKLLIVLVNREKEIDYIVRFNKDIDEAYEFDFSDVNLTIIYTSDYEMHIYEGENLLVLFRIDFKTQNVHTRYYRYSVGGLQ